MRTFAGIPEKYASRNFSKVWLQSIPYDGTSTWGKGADKGFSAFLEAADHLELYDIETGTEVYKQGIHILPGTGTFNTPEKMFDEVYKLAKILLEENRFLTFFGGEHSISIGIIKAFYEKFDDLTVLHLDAHTDLRSEFNGSRYNHACALHDASKNCNLVQVGIRSMDVSELSTLDSVQCFTVEEMITHEQWIATSLEQMTDDVYISLDLDVLDPSIMPSTGTPEPGGLDWYDITFYLREIFSTKNVVGFDIVEFAPISGLNAPNFLVAKLYYKMLSYKFQK